MRTCDYCGISIEGKRANARFCSSTHRVYFLRQSQGLPESLREADRWVKWNPIKRGKRWTKMPVTAKGDPASSTNAATWSSFEACKGSKRKGFMLGDGFACVDFDHVIVNGELVPEAQELLKAAPSTFMEVSPSGDGLHVWGILDERRGRRFVKDGVNVEIYSARRFMTVTEQRWNRSPSKLADLTDFVDVLTA